MNLLKVASTVSLLTLVSRITGLVREQLIAVAFGASAATDAFNVAFRIPNLFRRLFAEGAFAQAFVPLLAATRTSEGDVATRSLLDAVATVLTWALLVTCALGVVGAPVLVWVIGSGLEQFDTAVALTRWMFPYIGCMSLVALAAGVLNTWRRFAVPAATPVLLNLAVIAAAWWLAPWLETRGVPPIFALAAGVMAGGVVQLLAQWPALRAIGMVPRVALGWSGIAAGWRHDGTRRVLKQMAPALLGVSVAQLSLVINTQIASHIAVGAVSWLSYADRLMEFPTALLGVALGVVLLPQLAAAKAGNDDERYQSLLDWGLRLALLLALPCAMALLLFPVPLVTVLFHYGRFADGDVAATAWALRGYGAGLVGLIGVKVLAPAYFARADVATPVRIAIGVLIATQVMNLLFVPWLGHAGLALAIGLGALANAGFLLAGLLRRGWYRFAAGWGLFLARIAPANAVIAIGLLWMAQALDWVGMKHQPLARVGWLAAALAGVALVYFALLAAAGLRPAQFMRRA